MHELKIVVGGRDALPVRALPFVTSWMVTPSAMARALSGEDNDHGLVAYRENGGSPARIKPEAWATILEGIEDRMRERKRAETEPNEHRQAARREAVELLPAGVFIWLDDAVHWFSSTFLARDTVWDEVHRVPGEDDDPEPVFCPRVSADALDLAPLIQPDEHRLVIAGFEAYFAADGAPESTTKKPRVANGRMQATTTEQQLSATVAGPVDEAQPIKPWMRKDPRDPEPDHFMPWYTAARYFARQLVLEDSTLLNKTELLAAKVSKAMEKVGIYKRGGKKALDPATVKKAFFKVTLS